MRLREHGAGLILSVVPQQLRDLFERTGTLDVIGADSVVVETAH